MRTFCLCLFCLFLLGFQVVSFGQVAEGESTIEVSTASLQKANNQFQKELIRLEKRYKKKLSKLYPDVPTENLDSLVKEEFRLKKKQYKTQVKDSATNYIRALKEKLTNDLKETPEKLPVAKEIQESIQQLEKLEEIRTLLKDPKQLESAFDIKELNGLDKRANDLKSSLSEYKSQFKDWDQKLLEEVSNLPQVRKIKDEFMKAKSFKPLPESFQKPELFQSNDFVKEKLEAKADQLKQAGAATLQEKLNAAQAKVTDMKSEFPSLESIEEAPKRYNPHKGEPFLKRVILGGNLQLNREKPLSINAVLSLTYPLSKKTAVGISGGGRVFLERTTQSLSQENQFNIRSFARYNLWKEFHLQANYEFTRLRNNANDNRANQSWVRNALFGISRTTQLTPKIKMNLAALYDFFYNPQTSPNNQPWVVRVGFNFGKK